MHPLRPATHHNTQLIGAPSVGIASLPPSVASAASAAYEGVQIEEAVAAASISLDDKPASLSSLTLPQATDAQHLSSIPTDSRGKAGIGGIGGYRLSSQGDGDSDVACGAAIKLGDDQFSHSSSTKCFGVLKPSLVNWGSLGSLPNEILLHVLSFLDLSDLLATSRTNHLLRVLSLSPILHHYRLQRTRQILPPLLSSPGRPTVADLIARSIFLTHTSVISRRLAWSLVSIRLSRRLAARPPAEVLVERCVLPKECVPGLSSVHVAPGLVAKRKAVEKERIKDGLRRWIAGKWKGEVREREEQLKRWHESRGVGRVWKLTRFWERVSRGEILPLG